MLSHNFTLIMLSRAILGLGIGLFSPHAISLIAHVYRGELRARLLGYQTGLSALGNAVLLAGAGWLVVISWQAVFWLYLVLAIIALLVWRFVPETKLTTTTTKLGHAKLPASHWGLAGLTFITYLLIWGVQLKLPSLFANRHFGDASILNWTLAAMNLGGLIAGLTFGRLHKRLHRYTLTLGYAGAAASILLLWLTNQSTVAIGAAIFFNFIYSYTGPYLVFTSNAGLADEQINTMSSYLTIATIISAFFAPLVWNLLGQLGPGVLTDNVLLWIMLILTLIAVATLLKPTAKGTLAHGK
ncbi:MFS transporter [Lactiplantibacillus sp. WILCCON 0030]|uniref:MFS transporter n=2 Tax=Lactiplantibacillus brownii TaxID=3069269 RepID=A0ABU1A6R7_9LACO|nr:MFS transporter [Lactiplantibacillus brownii]MDQ7936375.1 MFS transporter [Lactiplantibacillus brownii]